jgi:integrase
MERNRLYSRHHPHRKSPESRKKSNRKHRISNYGPTQEQFDRSLAAQREFRKITEAAGLGTDWVPRELRHTFVSLLSSDGMPLEDIADLLGHKGTLTTETVYRKLIVPELRRGAKVMDRLFR